MRASSTLRVLNLSGCFSILLLTGEFVMADEQAAVPGLPAGYVENDKLQQTKGPEHEAFLNRAGTWNVTMKFNEMFGGATDKSVVKIRTVLDGKFLVEEGSGTQMGQPVKTMSILGYDSLTKEYSIVNLNSAYTGMFPMTGKKREDGIVEYTGIMKDAMTPAGRKYRAEEKTVSDDKSVVTVFDGDGSKEFVVFTMTYERAKDR